MARLRQEKGYLTTYDLLWLICVYEQDPASVTHRQAFITYALSTEVLRFFFGDSWTNENVFSMHSGVSKQHRKGREFLKTDAASNDAHFRHRHRVMMLAELLLNAQGVNGIDQRIASMKEGDLEAALGELECASLLLSRGCHCWLVQQCGLA